MKISIVFENEYFILIDKEPMVLTTPARTGEADPRPCLGTDLQNQLGQQIFPVHRLDFEVSGVVVFAKQAKAHSLANTWFEKKQVLKTYQAVTSQTEPAASLPVTGEEFRWQSHLLRGKRRTYEHATGKPSETIATYLGNAEMKKNWQQWRLQPLTGRPHQLRYELYRHGFPIVGDALYSSHETWSSPGIALRAVRIDFSNAPRARELGLPDIITVSELF